MNRHTIVFSETYAKNHWLIDLRKNKQILPYTYQNGLMPLTQVKHNYPFFIYDQFEIHPDLAKRFIKYFDYINETDEYRDPKILFLQKVKNKLIENDLIKSISVNEHTQIIQLDHGFVPRYLKIDESRESIPLVNEDIDVYQSKNPQEQVYAVFEKITELLDKEVPIEQIKIVNTTNEDDYHLKKLLFDAHLPLNIRKAKSIRDYPIYKKIKKSLLTDGIDQTKTLIQSLKPRHPEVMNALIKVFNRYLNKTIQTHLSLFISECDQIQIQAKRIKKAIDIISIDQINDLNHYYLMMNYIDEVFPKKDIDNDYLSNNQKRIIDYPTSEEINQYRLKAFAHLFNGLNHLVLFYPLVLIDQTRIASLKLKRKYRLNDYNYHVKSTSFLKTDDLLRYAIEKDLSENYHIDLPDYHLLNKHYQKLYKVYSHQFSGIHTDDLNQLLLRKYSLTGTKIEKYKLCPFQYFLSYLLMFDDFEDSHYIYFGNQIHKALEKLIENPHFNYIEMVQNSSDFPQDISYKKDLYNEILIENIDKISQIIFNFLEETAYKKILTEHQFSSKLKPDDRFLVNGVIDKLMIDEEKGYYVIVDYKYSAKSFTIDELKKGKKLQLPFYLYMFDKENDLLPSGLFYRQTGYQKEKANQTNDYRMNGVFLNNPDQMKRLDPQGLHIKSLKYTKNGLYNYGKNISENDFLLMKQTIGHMIYDTAEQIEKGNFIIQPNLSEEVNKQSISCQYCPFAHICYSKNKYLEEASDDDIYSESE